MTPYASSDLIWATSGSRVEQEHDDESLRDVKLTTNTAANWADYDTVFYRRFLANADAVEQTGVQVERLQLDDMPYGFGAIDGWAPVYDEFPSEIF